MARHAASHMRGTVPDYRQAAFSGLFTVGGPVMAPDFASMMEIFVLVTPYAL